MSNIKKAFQNGKAFIPFITCGDPDLETTAAIIREMERNGADLIELGIPFSDPTAEGPVILGSSLRAVKAGTTTDKVLQMVKELRNDPVNPVKVPLVFMTYANVMFSYGTERFAKISAEAGMDGIILPDVPYEEKEEFAPICREFGLDFISLIAPTSSDRINCIAKSAEGFLYVVSSLGVTGVRESITTDVESMVKSVKSVNPDIPCAIGFGIAQPEQARDMAAISDGVIVGSAIVKIIEKYGRDSAVKVGEYVKKMKEAANGR